MDGFTIATGRLSGLYPYLAAARWRWWALFYSYRHYSMTDQHVTHNLDHANAAKHASFLDSVNRKNLALRRAAGASASYPVGFKSSPGFDFDGLNQRNCVKRSKIPVAVTDFVLRLLRINPRAFL